MSIFPSVDIVSDVARAADPRRANAALKRLNAFADSKMGPAPVFAKALDQAPATSKTLPTLARAYSASDAPARVAQNAKPPAAAAAEKFEAYVLQTWLELMLPKEDGAFYGSSGAGGVWRSMMAEQLGGQLAKAGGIGLRRIVEKDHQLTAVSRDISTPQV